MISYYLFTSNR